MRLVFAYSSFLIVAVALTFYRQKLAEFGAEMAEMSEKITVLVVEKIARTEKFLLGRSI